MPHCLPTRDECCSYLNRVGLCAADYVDREVDTSLSGGEVKRIEIATILARPGGLLIYSSLCCHYCVVF